MGISAGEILTDVNLLVDLFAKVTTNVVQAQQVLKGSPPDATAAEQLAEAKAKLASIQMQSTNIDGQFDAALAAALADPE